MTNERFTNPFPGLRPFESTEDHLFFGRDGQSDELLRRLRRSRFLAVLGTSGSGKSSLVRAGMLPSLFGGLMTQAGSGWRVALFRPGHDPIGNLAAALTCPQVFETTPEDAELQKTITEATLRRSALGLVEATRQARIPENENLLVVVDQFEEIFRFRRTSKREGPEDEAAAFIKLLLEATRQTSVPIYIVITMRSDFLGDCAQFRDLPEAINDGQYLIPRMTRDQRREAITGPVAVGGGEISGRLVNRLLNEVGDNPDQLPILQHALMRTWDFWLHDRKNGEPIDFRHYDAAGTMSQALSQHADEAYADLPDDRSRALAEKLFKGLTEKGTDNRETRRPTRLGELCAIAEASTAEMIAVSEPFRRSGRSFLMPSTSLPVDENSMFDISHESLIRGWERLRKWVEEEGRSAHIYRRLAETAALHGRGDAGLWHDPDLALAVRWRDTNRPNAAWAEHCHPSSGTKYVGLGALAAGVYDRQFSPDFQQAMAFIDASRIANEAEIAEREHKRRRDVRRTRIFATVLGVAFLMSLGFGVFAFDARTRAYSSRNEAVKERNQAEAARKEADQERAKAELAKAEAQRSADRAEEERKRAEEQARIADEQKIAAEAATERARQALIVAEQATKRAEFAATEALRTAMVFRKTYLGDKNNIITLSGRLTELSSPEEAAVWRNYYATAMAEIGRPDLSKVESARVLETFPDNIGALTNRGYMSLINFETIQALRDFERVRQLDPQYSLNYLNLGVAQANLKDYSGAANSIQKAIEWYRPGYFDGVFDSEVSEDIRQTTGRHVIYAEGNEFNAALYYELAGIEAFRGGRDFETKLNEADQNAARSGTLTEGYLTALNWGWMQQRKEPKDYGAWVIQAHLWRKAGYEDWGRYYYQKFECDHERLSDARYDGLAAFVKRELRSLPKSREVITCEKPPFVNRDTRTKIFEANEWAQIGHYDDALNLLDPEVEKDPTNIDLLLSRARYRRQAGFWAGRFGNEDRKKKYFAAAANDFTTLMKLAEERPSYKAIVYLWWSVLGPEIAGMSDADVKRYSQEVINLGPSNSGALTVLSKAEADPLRAIEYMKRSIALDPSADSYYQMATLQNKVGDHHGALQSIKFAIALQSDNVEFYQERQRAEIGLGVAEVEREMHLAEGYCEIGDVRLRELRATSVTSEKEKAYIAADDAYRRSLDILSRLTRNEKVLADLAMVNAKLARLQDLNPKRPEN